MLSDKSIPPYSGVLIVIPCLNEAEVIEQVIDRVLGDAGLNAPRLVVADGGSTDGSLDIVRRLAAIDGRISLLNNPKRLQSAGVNLAARQADSAVRWLVRVDAHADYPANYASTLIAEAERTQADSVVVGMDTRGVTFFQRAAAAAQNSVLGTGGSAHRICSAGQWVDHGHHALFRLERFLAIGGYDEGFSHNEDAEFDLRLAAAGGRIWLTDKAVIGYYPRRSPAALWRQYLNYGAGRARTVRKHSARLKPRQALPLAVAPAVVLALAAPLYPPLALPALGWLGACLAFGLLIGARKKGDPAALAAGVPAAIMHLAWSAGFWRETLQPPRSVGANLGTKHSAA